MSVKRVKVVVRSKRNALSLSLQSCDLWMVMKENPDRKNKQTKKELLCVIRSFLQVGFPFHCQLINLAWLPFYFYSFSWSLTTCFFVALYSWVCSCPKISGNVFYLWLYTFLVFIFQSTCFIYFILFYFILSWKRKQTMEHNRIVHVNERNQNKNKTKLRHIQIDHALYCSFQNTHNAMVSLKDGFTVSRQS